jgi:hypothetical protein
LAIPQSGNGDNHEILAQNVKKPNTLVGCEKMLIGSGSGPLKKVEQTGELHLQMGPYCQIRSKNFSSVSKELLFDGLEHR